MLHGIKLIEMQKYSDEEDDKERGGSRTDTWREINEEV